MLVLFFTCTQLEERLGVGKKAIRDIGREGMGAFDVVIKRCTIAGSAGRAGRDSESEYAEVEDEKTK